MNTLRDFYFTVQPFLMVCPACGTRSGFVSDKPALDLKADLDTPVGAECVDCGRQWMESGFWARRFRETVVPLLTAEINRVLGRSKPRRIFDRVVRYFYLRYVSYFGMRRKDSE